jgi:hypothetical protein
MGGEASEPVSGIVRDVTRFEGPGN